MDASLTSRQQLRRRAWPWIGLAPVFWLMALVWPVEPASAYRAQLVLVSMYALASAVFGIAGVVGRPWARRGLRVLAFLGAGYFLGAAALALCHGVWSASSQGHLMPAGAGVMVAASALLPGLLFLRAARNLAQATGAKATAR